MEFLPHETNDATYLLHQYGSLLKPNRSCFEFLKSSFVSNLLHIEHTGVSLLQQRAFVSLCAATVLTMFQNGVKVEVFFSAKVTRADVEVVQQPRIE